MRIAILPDSIGTRNNGAAQHCWPRDLGTMIEDGGVFDIEVRNYGIPGLRWGTAHLPTPGWLIGGTLSPLDAIKRDGCDILIFCLGVNDCVVTQADQAAMDAVYAALGGEGFTVNLGKLYDLGYSYDMLHPTNSGKQWVAAAVYMYLQQTLPLTPISRNIAWFYEQPPAVREQMRVANT